MGKAWTWSWRWRSPSAGYRMGSGRCATVGGCRCWVCFFFQAEDGIRDVAVTGVQTCALPIWGLGLYVSRAILRSFGGELAYEARPVGCCFVISVPALCAIEEAVHA